MDYLQAKVLKDQYPYSRLIYVGKHSTLCDCARRFGTGLCAGRRGWCALPSRATAPDVGSKSA